ncbi:hypothetical protein K439DRAFT_1328377, partial [Ramaria rubella]
VPFGVTYEKIGTIQRRLAWPLHKDDTLLQSGRSSDRNIYFFQLINTRNFYRRMRMRMTMEEKRVVITWGCHGF